MPFSVPIAMSHSTTLNAVMCAYIYLYDGIIKKGKKENYEIFM